MVMFFINSLDSIQEFLKLQSFIQFARFFRQFFDNYTIDFNIKVASIKKKSQKFKLFFFFEKRKDKDFI